MQATVNVQFVRWSHTSEERRGTRYAVAVWSDGQSSVHILRSGHAPGFLSVSMPADRAFRIYLDRCCELFRVGIHDGRDD